jgi:hypothetical protein
MRALFFSGRRIKTPERGLLALHPFVDVLEGRSLFTATAHDGVMDVTAVVDAPAGEGTPTPWSTEYIDQRSAAATAAGEAAAAGTGGLGELLVATTPGRIELEFGTSGSAFSFAGTIGDTSQTLFGNALWDRRGRVDAPPLPTDAQVAVAREAPPPAQWRRLAPERLSPRMAAPALRTHAGSCPCPPQGWHRQIRLTARQLPPAGPCLLIASIAYWLHDGVYRQCPPRNRPSVTR